MNQEDIQEIINQLREFSSEFNSWYPKYKSGRNKKIRDEAQRELEFIMYRVKRYFSEVNVFEILNPDSSLTGQAYFYDEFFMYRYFGRDVQEMIRNLEELKDQMGKA